jgi:hypothetical protein
MFVIVAFDDTNETEFAPVEWIADDTRISDVTKLIKSRARVKFYWPPMKSSAAVSRAQNQCLGPDVSWPMYFGRILGTASMKLDI